MNSSILPSGNGICEVSIIDTTTVLVGFTNIALEPEIKGHELLNLPTFAFLVKHPTTGKTVLFDLGCRKDWHNSVPAKAEVIAASPGFQVLKDMPEILKDAKIDLSSISAIILSHWHFDHCGDPSAFPASTDLIVGPGFRQHFVPGYPANRLSPFWSSAFESRRVTEVEFNPSLTIGGMPAFDYFEDGSFYLLDAPGHDIGHICGLVRTTSNTAILLGADAIHFPGGLRPSSAFPLSSDPKALHGIQGQSLHRISTALSCHPEFDKAKASITPFYQPASRKDGLFIDHAAALKTVSSLMNFDADPNVLVIIAHDPTPLEILPFFPNHTLNEWHNKGWKEQMRWAWLDELPENGLPGKQPALDGSYLEGRRIRDLEGNAV